ncbi:PD-(D/E)XK motif protein [Saccharothrix sp. 6-C]|uniref:PD-(D/E)XK motif protein n=1 Tax=Saccharothrix sp. 6-C TaxID=2781735 RepID=UPI0019173EBC|nr:PD-(D/E)XK motif protein [Saccharothrix sp. 6-C]QQQ74777.1 PD-(D/E)XK motif protein [Saccharothrix sp. 6-C]
MTAVPSTTDLEELWGELHDTQSGAVSAGRRVRRVLADSPHHCFVGVEYPAARRVFSVATDNVPANATNGLLVTSGVVVERGSLPDHGATLDLVLRAGTYTDIFTALVADLLVRLAQVTAEPGGVVVNRLGEWQRMLAGVSPDGLSREQQRGLFGELHTLSDLFLPRFGSNAVYAWTGPDQQLQDFQFEQGSVEVKTATGHDANRIRVSSERQLDDAGPGALFLVTLALDVRQGGRGVSLPELVRQVRKQASNLGVAGELEQRLVRAGYLDTQSRLYEDRRYALRGRTVHRVTEGFPRITEQTRPVGVSDIVYTVDLLAAVRFLVNVEDMIAVLEMKA